MTGLEKADLVIRGERSELRLSGGAFTIHKEATTQRTPTEIDFTVEEVRGVTLNAPPRGRRGWLHVAVVGGSPPPPSELAATGDPYTLPLTSRAAGSARKLAKLIDRHVQARGKPVDRPRTGRLSSGVVVNPSGEPSPKRPLGKDAPRPLARASTPPTSTAGRESSAKGSSKPAGKSTAKAAKKSTKAGKRSTKAAPKRPATGGSGLAEGNDVEMDLVTQLQQLADLHRVGALTDEEFERAKGRILG